MFTTTEEKLDVFAVLFPEVKREVMRNVLENPYTNLRYINGMFCGVQRFAYTVGVCFGLDESGYKGRFCFDSEMNADYFLHDWDGKTLPVVGDDGCTAIKGNPL
ncbi:MAG: hypothetical protein RTU92_08555 [Candidatus Thorarchaeota archaeon]